MSVGILRFHVMVRPLIYFYRASLGRLGD